MRISISRIHAVEAVNEDGRVVNPKILSGPPELYDAVLKTVVTWRYKPARRGTQTLRRPVKRAIRFRLEDA